MRRLVPRHWRTLLPIMVVLAGMGTLVYYAAPLYDMFCRVTGIGGTTQRADAGTQTQVVDQKVRVRFSTQVADDLPWTVTPPKTVTVQVGERNTVFFEAENTSNEAIVSHAAYNVTPLKVGEYISKIECFCFTEERLKPGQHVRMPVQFFVSPQMLKDSTTDDVRQLTLSYTFFHSANPEGAKDLDRLDTPQTSRQPENGGQPDGDSRG
ncbi:Cytochrome c oxidase assembly protein Cox11 [Limimonas halophila]|uniref:Cytochrome c oxidase assembly protein CtaG n=1 Tax=Limimonas halophila TaxID=1082479 RepID=A0A1G7RB76_9PROT|nr:cytochrome c oxidase assembly protein [Limimonas halophila]SDG08017.1 Cytochrome c oxidase assembly protein Cox11 [Limimonas halophila]